MTTFIQIISGKNPIAVNFDNVRAIARKADGLSHVVFTDGTVQDLTVPYNEITMLLNVKVPVSAVGAEPTMPKPKRKRRIISKGIGDATSSLR